MPTRSLPVESRSRRRPSGAGFRRTATQMALSRCAIAHRGADWYFWRGTPAIACVAARLRAAGPCPRPDRPPAGRAQCLRPNGCIDIRLHPVTTTAIRHAQVPAVGYPPRRYRVQGYGSTYCGDLCPARGLPAVGAGSAAIGTSSASPPRCPGITGRCCCVTPMAISSASSPPLPRPPSESSLADHIPAARQVPAGRSPGIPEIAVPWGDPGRAGHRRRLTPVPGLCLRPEN